MFPNGHKVLVQQGYKLLQSTLVTISLFSGVSKVVGVAGCGFLLARVGKCHEWGAESVEFKENSWSMLCLGYLVKNSGTNRGLKIRAFWWRVKVESFEKYINWSLL